MYYRELFAVWREPGAAYDSVAGRDLFVLSFQVADVEMDIPSFVDDVRVLVFCWADVCELAVPVLKGEPLELRVFFDVKQSDSLHSLIVSITRNVDPFVVPRPAADDIGSAIIYRGEDDFTPRF